LTIFKAYPSDWKVSENDILNRYEVMFAPPSKGVYVAVGITNNVTSKEIDRMKTPADKTPSYMSPSTRLLEADYKHYSLSGYPAVRLILIQSYEGPGEPYDVKSMVYGTLVESFILLVMLLHHQRTFRNICKLHNQ
jgi:hypothetical protein